MPTAIMAGGNRITLYLMKTMRDRGIECPEEISVVGFGDEGWSELTYPPLTILKRDVEGLSRRAVNMLFEKINTGHVIEQDYYADVELIIRKSTRMLDNGPFGEEAATPESIVITKEEKAVCVPEISVWQFHFIIQEHHGRNYTKRESAMNWNNTELILYQ